MFCKVCHDAGKSKVEYSSHFVKSEPGPNGKVICPYLLGLSCRYCKERGHTIKHCQKLKNKREGPPVRSRNERYNRSGDDAVVMPAVQWNQSRSSSFKNENRFDILREEINVQEEEEEERFTPQEQNIVFTPQLSGWAAVVAKKPSLPLKKCGAWEADFSDDDSPIHQELCIKIPTQKVDVPHAWDDDNTNRVVLSAWDE